MTIVRQWWRVWDAPCPTCGMRTMARVIERSDDDGVTRETICAGCGAFLAATAREGLGRET